MNWFAYINKSYRKPQIILLLQKSHIYLIKWWKSQVKNSKLKYKTKMHIIEKQSISM